MIADPATAYARGVVSGKVVAGPDVRAACARHLRDLERRDLIWAPRLGQRFAKFARACVVFNPLEQEWVPFELLPWQQFFCYSLLGWLMRPGARDTLQRVSLARRFRFAYVITARGSGKSPLASALALYMMVADGRYTSARLRGGEWKLSGWKPSINSDCYALASTIDQIINVAMKPAKLMIDQSDALAGAFDVHGGDAPDRITCLATNSFYQVASGQTKEKGLSGRVIQFVLGEELHEWGNSREGLDILINGFKGRPQPLCMMVTNPGQQKIGVGWVEHLRAVAAAKGDGADNYFSFPCGLDEGDLKSPAKVAKGGSVKWVPDQSVWRKANPGLGVIIRPDYILGEAANANTPQKRAEVLRMNFCVWSDAAGEFMSWEQWSRAEVAKLRLRRDWPCVLGCDLAALHDLTALALVWRSPSGKLHARVEHWTAADTLRDRDVMSSGNLEEWARKGEIHTVPGQMLDFDVVARRIIELHERWNFQAIVVDALHKWRELARALERHGFEHYMEDERGAGIKIVRHPQGNPWRAAESEGGNGLWMNSSVEALRMRILGAAKKGAQPTINIEANSTLRWNLFCAVLRSDSQSNVYFDKQRALRNNQGAIDGLVALTMAVGYWDRSRPRTAIERHYEERRRLGAGGRAPGRGGGMIGV